MAATLLPGMPGSIRLFVTAPLWPGGIVTLSAEQAHYLGGVMRRATGESVLLFNGRDGEFSARLVRLQRDRAEVELVAPSRPQAAEPDFWLAFAALKRDATELVIEKATELGVSRLLPVVTQRTNTARLNLERLGAIAAEAAEQCERLSVPEIAPLQPLHALLAGWPAQRRLATLIERSAAPALDNAAAPGGPGGLLVGPEGGFAPAELDALARCTFTVPASLGSRILRAETAAIAGLARLLAHPDA